MNMVVRSWNNVLDVSGTNRSESKERKQKKHQEIVTWYVAPGSNEFISFSFSDEIEKVNVGGKPPSQE